MAFQAQENLHSSCSLFSQQLSSQDIRHFHTFLLLKVPTVGTTFQELESQFFWVTVSEALSKNSLIFVLKQLDTWL